MWGLELLAERAEDGGFPGEKTPMAMGLRAAVFDYTKAPVDEFHDLYDQEHIPERERMPGFGLCERWIDIANPKIAVATYDLDSLSVLASPA